MKNFFKKNFGLLKRKTHFGYTPYTVGGMYGEMKQDFKLLIKKNKDLLLFNGINLNKVRFVFTPAFSYDIDADIIDPSYVEMLPIKKNGRFQKNAPVLELSKPKNIVVVTVNSYKVNDNYDFIKKLVKKTKRGIVIYIIEHQDAVRLDGSTFNYEFSVDDDELRLKDLDEVSAEVFEDCL